MIIDFNKQSAKRIPNFKGGEKSLCAKIFSDNSNKLLHGVLESGATIGMHTHETNSEIIYILSGKGKVLYDGAYQEIEQGMCHYCPKGHSHSLINDSNDDLVFFAVIPEQ